MSTVIESDWENTRLKEEIESLRKRLEDMTEIARNEYLSAIDWAGKHQALSHELAEKDAEIAHRVTIDEMNAEIESATKAVALYYENMISASQAREQQLREYLQHCKLCVPPGQRQIVKAALAIPTDTTALEAMITKVGEVMRERCVDVIGPYGNTRYLSSYEEGCEDTKVGIDTEISALPPITLKDLE